MLPPASGLRDSALGEWSGLIQRTLRLAAWLLAAAIVVLSLVPPGHRPVSGAGHGFEHFAIFAATGVAFGAGYPARRLTVIAALPLFSAAIEIAQLAVPGRHARLSDFLVDAAAALVGAGLGWIAARLTGFDEPVGRQ